MWLQRFILLVKDEMYFWGTTNHKAEICSLGNKKSFPPVYSASEEAAHRKRYRGCGLPGGSHAICPRHNRLQFSARVRPGAGGKPMYWSHNIQGSTASSWRKYFFKILERKERNLLCIWPTCLDWTGVCYCQGRRSSFWTPSSEPCRLQEGESPSLKLDWSLDFIFSATTSRGRRESGFRLHYLH